MRCRKKGTAVDMGEHSLRVSQEFLEILSQERRPNHSSEVNIKKLQVYHYPKMYATYHRESEALRFNPLNQG